MSIRNFLGKARCHVKAAVPNAKQRIIDTGVHKHIDTAAKTTIEITSKVQKAGSDALDAIMRQSIDDQVREHILLQDRYNDVLAMKLDEALKRIENLEQKVARS